MFPSIRFSYQLDDYAEWREIICRKLTEATSTVIQLPREIIIHVANLGPSTYGSAAVEFRFRNKVSISNVLSANEIPIVLVHELIHLNQIHTGILRSSRHGTYYWNNKPYYTDVNILTFEQHQQLPWEVDVSNRHSTVLKEALDYAMKR